MNNRNIAWVIIILVLSALACSLGGGGGDESASSQVSIGEEGSDASAPTQPPVVEDIETVEEETPTPEPEPEAVEFPGVMGLEQFDSYRANIIFEFTDASGDFMGDETTSQHQEILIEVNKNPEIWHQVNKIESEGAIEVDTESEAYYADDLAYTKAFDNWLAQAGLLGRSQFMNPGLFAHLPETALCDSEAETINGVSAIRCSFTEEDNVSYALDAAAIEGDVWIAEDGNYILKYVLDVEGLDLKGAFDSGGFEFFKTYDIVYELTDINEVTIELPAEAQGADLVDSTSTLDEKSGLAALEGGDVFFDAFAGMSYYSTADLESIVDFHLEDLAAAGWAAIPVESYVEEDGYALLVFEDKTGGILRVYAQRDLGHQGYFVSMTLPYDIPDFAGDDSSAGGAESGTSGSDFPLLDNAEEVNVLGGFVNYYTASDISSVVDFYRQQFSADGWEEDATASVVQPDTLGMLQFKKDGETLMMTAAKEDDGRTNVIIVAQ
ncbi:MAG: hypothetical protein GY796_14290 [Chloroflexi bacterium]|nr:hypothetical protein [Chloroflexota bacterium]